jgi:SOS response regulatory protein OraA/RecX
MDILKQQKFIDDKMFAQMYINSEVIKKGKPLISITKKLEFRGISKDIIKQVERENQEDIGE